METTTKAVFFCHHEDEAPRCEEDFTQEKGKYHDVQLRAGHDLLPFSSWAVVPR
jgi:hypothetical protein